MSEGFELVGRAVFIGIGATLVMDLWTVYLKRFLGVRTLDYRMVGRWIGHFPGGRFVHPNIAEASAVRGERALGWASHYAIGIVFAALLLALCGLNWARSPTIMPALAFGLLSVTAPFLLMQPGMGAGIAARRTPNPHLARLRSMATHAVFGTGLYGAARLLEVLVQAWA